MMAPKFILLLSVLLTASVFHGVSALLGPLQAATSSSGRPENHDASKGPFAANRMTGRVNMNQDAEDRDENNYPCQIRSRKFVMTDFQNISIQNIRDISVGAIKMNYCAGHCHYQIPQEVSKTQSGLLRSALASRTNKVPEPCCAPDEFKDVRYPSRKHGIVTLSIVKSCHCR